MADKLLISFEIVNDAIHPDEITRLTGIEPTDALLKGTRKPELNLPRNNIWRVSSEFSTDEFETHWDFVRDRLHAGDLNALKRSIGNGSAMFTIFFWADNRGPAFEIPKDMMEIALFLDARIQIDS
ncbi:DUF4279 domain-containing protein [Fulvimarina sp. MAC8]|uniref:DUF4279 domain-containing protein n=1 Tax=Fulvimarina sp. MAC8 TaxID=3162874 RepID=UPI0032EECE1A